MDRKERIIVGVNRYLENDKENIPTLKIEHEIEQGQIEKMRRLKQKRNQADVKSALLKIQNAARIGGNIGNSSCAVS